MSTAFKYLVGKYMCYKIRLWYYSIILLLCTIKELTDCLLKSNLVSPLSLHFENSLFKSWQEKSWVKSQIDLKLGQGLTIGSANYRILYFQPAFLLTIKASNCCASLVSKDCLVTWSSAKIPANPAILFLLVLFFFVFLSLHCLFVCKL